MKIISSDIIPQKCIMSLTDIQSKQIKNKVLYSELDTPFNKYFDILSRSTKLCNQILKGQLKEEEGTENQLSKSLIQELRSSAEARFLEAQLSIETKKIRFENWQQSNQDTQNHVDEHVKAVLPELRETRLRLAERLARIRNVYDSVYSVNNEIEALSEGRTSITVTKQQWEKELGPELTEKLISKKYLRLDNRGSSMTEQKFRVYDDFSRGPKEVRHFNKKMRSDIDKLSIELGTYKDKWLKDADVFSKITEVLQDELTRRNLEVSKSQENNESSDDDDDEENINRHDRQRNIEDIEESNYHHTQDNTSEEDEMDIDNMDISSVSQESDGNENVEGNGDLNDEYPDKETKEDLTDVGNEPNEDMIAFTPVPDKIEELEY